MKKFFWVSIPMLLSLGIMGWLIFSSWQDLNTVMRNVTPGFLALSFVFSVATYTFIGFSLWEILRLIGYRLPILEVVGIAFVSTTANYFVSSAGISGFALRAHLLRKRHVPYAATVTASVVITVLLYGVLALIVFQGFLFQLLQSRGADMRMLEGMMGVLIPMSFAFLVGAVFFHHELRARWSRRLFRSTNHVIYFFSRKEIPPESFDQFEKQLEKGIHLIHQKKRELTRAVSYVCADWVFNLLILFFAFRAIGIHIGPGQLIIGFTVGMVATLIPILPGGLGAMEATMTAVYAQMGIPWGSALMASLIFRFTYHVFPSFLSIFFYWGLKVSEPAGFPSGIGKRLDRHGTAPHAANE
ncbi:MAG: lysylphosphatidylglycerol synthase transmembrane domain-containing protein [bacterium]